MEEKKWYVVNTYSGHENKVKEKLEMRAESMGLQDYIFRVIVPEQTVVEEKDGVTKEKVKKMFPGYILVEMVMSDEAWFVVRNTPGVTGFIGSSGKGAKPTPLQPYEVETILNNMGISRIDAPNELKEGDKILKIGKTEVTTVAGFRYSLYKYKLGDKVVIIIEREGKVKEVTVTLKSK